MKFSLSPANLGEILDRTANLYRSSFLVFVGIAAVPAGILLVSAGSVYLAGAWAREGDPAAAAAFGIVSLAFFLVACPVYLGVAALATSALTNAANDLYLGERTSIRAAYGKAWKCGWRALGLFVLQVLILYIAPGIMLAIVIGLTAAWSSVSGSKNENSQWIVFVLFSSALLVYVIWMLLRICLAFPAMVSEGLGAGAAFKRSWKLSKGTRARILVLYLLRTALSWMISLVIWVPALIAINLLPHANSAQHLSKTETIMGLLFYGSSFAAQAFVKPVSAIALVVFAYDQRVRTEGFDIEWMMRRAGMVSDAQPQRQTVPWLSAVSESPGTAAPAAPPEPPQEPTGETQ